MLTQIDSDEEYYQTQSSFTTPLKSQKIEEESTRYAPKRIEIQINSSCTKTSQDNSP